MTTQPTIQIINRYPEENYTDVELYTFNHNTNIWTLHPTPFQSLEYYTNQEITDMLLTIFQYNSPDTTITFKDIYYSDALVDKLTGEVYVELDNRPEPTDLEYYTIQNLIIQNYLEAHSQLTFQEEITFINAIRKQYRPYKAYATQATLDSQYLMVLTETLREDNDNPYSNN